MEGVYVQGDKQPLEFCSVPECTVPLSPVYLMGETKEQNKWLYVDRCYFILRDSSFFEIPSSDEPLPASIGKACCTYGHW